MNTAPLCRRHRHWTARILRAHDLERAGMRASNDCWLSKGQNGLSREASGASLEKVNLMRPSNV
jgi:hypothetical protein